MLFKLFNTSFVSAQAAATLTAITTNFLLNNTLTYRDRRLTGVKLLFGWISFNLVCAIGAAANVGIANWMLANNSMWLVDGLAGITVGVVWNLCNVLNLHLEQNNGVDASSSTESYSGR